ncbi:hypothetical protein scyTo_0016244, partial [Scyliorhinus torazame]|nr:hypothetical protein [Scyliorhinus torazame]
MRRGLPGPSRLIDEEGLRCDGLKMDPNSENTQFPYVSFSPKPDQDEEAPDTAQTGETIEDDAEEQVQTLISEPAASPDIVDVPEDTQTNMGEPTEDVAEERDQTPTAEPPPSPSIVEDVSEDIQANMGEADVVQGDRTPSSGPLSSPELGGDTLEDSERNMTLSDEVTSGMIKSSPVSPDEISDAQDRKTERSRASTQSSIQDISIIGLPNLSLQLQCPSNVPLVCDSDDESDVDYEQAELVVLDPDHPLMKRFQEALKNHLSKQLDKLTLELRDLTWRMKKQTTEREDTGVILYGTQQSLAQIQMELEKLHDHCSAASTKRRKAEEDLAHIRNLYQVSQTTTNSEHSKVSQLQTEVENIALRHFYMENLKHDVCSDIMVMKRATEKLEIEKVEAAKQKQKQDMFVDRLVSQIDALREKTAMYEAQYIAQAEETKAARKTVAEASTEIDAIGYEKKQLLEQWNTSLIGMQRRDEAYSAMQKAVRESKHQLDTLKTEMHAYKSFIMKQEEKNEFLTVTLNRLTNDVNMTQKMIMQNLAKQEGLKHEYSTYTRTLHETERLLNKASLDKNTRLSEIKILQLQIEREYGTKVKLEDEIMAKWESNLTMNQATNYLKRLGEKLRIRKRQLEIDYAKTENEFAQISLDMNDRNGELSMLQKTLQEQHHELNEKNQVVSLCEKEIAKRLLSIQNKQSVLNMHNKKIAQLIAEMGGREMSPLELKIKTLTKNIEEHSKEISTQQQYWLKQQQELVRLTQEREKQTTDVELQKKQVTILEQKKIRTENMIQQELNAKKDIERHINALSHDMVKLNELLTKNTSMKNSLEQMNVLIENGFITALK